MLRQLYHNKEFLCFYHLFIRIIRSHCKEMLHVNLLKVKWKGFPSSDSMINFFISLGTGDKLLKVAGSQVEDAQKWIETWFLYFVHHDLNCCLPGMKTYKQFLSVFSYNFSNASRCRNNIRKRRKSYFFFFSCR